MDRRGDPDPASTGTTAPVRPPILRVGCPMWAHPAWVGRYLTPGRSGRELADYATWCNAVEGNTTFYAVPSAATVARWGELAPGDFRFAFKVPRTVTHDRRLRRDAHRDVAAFLRVIEPLGERIGPIQLQLPPSFGPDAAQVLCDFVVALPTSHDWVVELRHRTYFDDGPVHRRVDEVFAAAGIGRVVLDTRPLDASTSTSPATTAERRTKPRLPIVVDGVGATPCVRVIGADDPDDTFDGLAAWIPEVVGWLEEGRRPYVFVHQPENLDSPAIARRLHAAVRDRLPSLAPLPEPITVAPPGETIGQPPLF